MLTEAERKQAMAELRLEIAAKLCEIEDLCAARSLRLPRLSLIARDPKRPGMIVCVTNEPAGEIREAVEQLERETPEPR